MKSEYSVTVELGGKTYDLEFGTAEQIAVEDKYNMGMGDLMTKRLGVSVCTQILYLCMAKDDRSVRFTDVVKIVEKMVRESGLDSLFGIVTDLINKSGLLGKQGEATPNQ